MNSALTLKTRDGATIEIAEGSGEDIASSDRASAEYASQLWDVKPCPVQ